MSGKYRFVVLDDKRMENKKAILLAGLKALYLTD
jgi:hypothetical protein